MHGAHQDLERRRSDHERGRERREERVAPAEEDRVTDHAQRGGHENRRDEEGELGNAEELERADVEQPGAEAQLKMVGRRRAVDEHVHGSPELLAVVAQDEAGEEHDAKRARPRQNHRRQHDAPDEDRASHSAPARPEYCAMASRQRLYWALVFALGVGLRLALFSGCGLGDDPNFFQSYSSILRSGRYNPADHYQMRFGLWVPVVGSMRLLGVTEAGFIGAITACSIANLVLVYLLARQEWDRPWALLAMGLAAVYPLDVLCSTLFASDMILATYCFTALWLYRKALGAGEGGASRMVWAAASALLLFFGLVSEPWVG